MHAKWAAFLEIAARFNKIGVTPLLYGSLGLSERLRRDLHADDIDVLIPAEYLRGKWEITVQIMQQEGFALCDLHEHAFSRGGLVAAYAPLEELHGFAGVDIAAIPVCRASGAEYLLLALADYLRVYQASAKDGYRRDTKHKNDSEKIRLIMQAMNSETGGN